MGETPLAEKGGFPGQALQKHTFLYYSLIIAIIFISFLLAAFYYRVYPIGTYLTFHIIFEFSSIVVSFIVFIVAWYNYRETHSSRELAISITFFLVGCFDFVHSLSYNGMPNFFSVNSANKASTFWIIARLCEGIGVLIAVTISPKAKLSKYHPWQLLIGATTFIGAAIFTATQYPSLLPPMFIAGKGQTGVKIGLEYLVVMLKTLSLIPLLTKNGKLEQDHLLQGALLFGIASEIAFTMYSSAFDTYNLLGHILKIFAFVFLAKGLFLTTVVVLHRKNKALAIQRERMAEYNCQLTKANQLKNEFLANTNHELRTPLTAIIAFSELLQDKNTGPLNETQQDYLKEITCSGEKLLLQINHLLDLAKTEAGKMDLKLSSVSPHHIVDSAVRQINSLFRKKEQRLDVLVKNNLPMVYVDEERIQDVLLNLLGNANKFTPEGGVIKIEVELIEGIRDEIIFKVSDNGIGISKEDFEIIFEKFRQVDGSVTRNYRGTGLGLTIVKQVVELHGGKVWVESTTGVGSVFTFTLPVGPDTEE